MLESRFRLLIQCRHVQVIHKWSWGSAITTTTSTRGVKMRSATKGEHDFDTRVQRSPPSKTSFNILPRLVRAWLTAVDAFYLGESAVSIPMDD